MATEYDAGTVIMSIFFGGGTLLGGGVWLRDYLKGRTLTDVNRDAAINGVGINQQVLTNLVDEVARMKKREADLESRIADLEKRVDDLTTRLANVRMVAIDCYAIASKCECEGSDRLLKHLESIIRES